MSITLSTIESTGWDVAIKDARKNIEKLNAAIRVFEKNKAAGEPWPGEKAGTDAQSIPA